MFRVHGAKNVNIGNLKASSSYAQHNKEHIDVAQGLQTTIIDDLTKRDNVDVEAHDGDANVGNSEFI